MKISIIVITSFLCISTIQAQPNCNDFHRLLDSAILICPYFGYAYREKAAPYVKSGNLIAWRENIDLAVKYDSSGYLPVRASLRYKFFADYEGTIHDIELLEKISKTDIVYTSNGTYHLTVVKAICYKQLGKISEGIKILENLLGQKDYSVGLYDYLHLGVMYYQVGQYEKAMEALNKQLVQYDFAEVQYYFALCYK